MSADTSEHTQHSEGQIDSNKSYLSADYHRKLADCLNKVCRVEVRLNTRDLALGTGFLIGPDLVMTNYHVVTYLFDQENRRASGKMWAAASDVTLRFDYERPDAENVPNKGKMYALHPDRWLYDYSPMGPCGLPAEEELDYAILRLDDRPGDERGWIHFPEQEWEFAPDTFLVILQYPEGQPLCAADHPKAVVGFLYNRMRVRYRVNTGKGSSGAPCFNKYFELVALHHSGNVENDLQYNEGVPAWAIKNLLVKRRKYPFEREPKRKIVQLLLEGDFKKFTLEQQQNLVCVLGVLLHVDSSDIRVLKVEQGSLLYTLEIPEIAANRLYEMAAKHDSRLLEQGLKSIKIENREATLISHRLEDLENRAITQLFQNKDVNIFVSYAWEKESERTVNELERAFASRGIRIIRDQTDLAYKASIHEFEQRLGRGECVILVISDKYLRSEHCMYELMEVDRNQNIRERVFPIVLEDARIFKSIDRLGYINYWEERIEQLNQAIKQGRYVTNKDSIIDDLEKYNDIRGRFDHLSNLLCDMNVLTPQTHATSSYSILINAVANKLTGFSTAVVDTSSAQPQNEEPPDFISAIIDNIEMPQPPDMAEDPQNGEYRFNSSVVPNFVDRETQLKQIQQFIALKALKHKKTFVLICGMPGVGKSALAAELLKRIQWINEDHRTWVSIPEAVFEWKDLLSLLCSRLKLGKPNTNALHDYLSRTPALLILDGVEHLWEDKRFIDFLSRINSQMAGTVVLTSWVSPDELINNRLTIDLSPLPHRDARKLLIQAWGQEFSQITHEQNADIRRTLKQFENLPLSLVFIGYRAQNRKFNQLGDCLDEVLAAMERYNFRQDKALEQMLGAIEVSYNDMPAPAKKLFDRLTLFPGPVTNRELRVVAEVHPKIDFNAAVGEMIKASLINKAEDNYYHIHSVTRMLANQHLNEMDFDELKELKTVVGSHLLDNQGKMTRMLGLEYLFQIGDWTAVISGAKQKLGFRESALLDASDHDFLKVRACLALADIYYQQRTSNRAPKRSIEYVEKGRESLLDLHDPIADALCLRFEVILAYAHLNLGEIPVVTGLFDDIRDRVEKYRQDPDRSQQFTWEIGQAELFCGIVETRINGNFVEAERITRSALSKFEGLEDNRYMLRCYSNLGTILTMQEKFEESLEMSKQVLALKSSLEIDEEGMYLIACEYVNLVDTYTRQANYEQAYEIALEGITFCKDIDEIGAYSLLLLNTARVECELGNIAEAEEMLCEAGDKIGPLIAPIDNASIHSIWARIYAKRADWKAALRETKQVLTEFAKEEDTQIKEIVDQIRLLQDEILKKSGLPKQKK